MHQELFLALQSKLNEPQEQESPKSKWNCCRKKKPKVQIEVDPDQRAKNRWRKVAMLRYLLASVQMQIIYRAKQRALDMEIKMYEGQIEEEGDQSEKPKRK